MANATNKALYGCSDRDPAFIISLKEYNEDCDVSFVPPEGVNVKHYLLCDGCLLIQNEEGVVLHQTLENPNWERCDWFYSEQRPILNEGSEERITYYMERTK